MMRTIIITRRVETGLLFGSVVNFYRLIFQDVVFKGITDVGTLFFSQRTFSRIVARIL